MMKGLGEGILIALAGTGMKIENQKETSDGLINYISVPEHSYIIDAHGKEMAGDYLAKVNKEKLEELWLKNVVWKYRIRKGEYWTKEMDKAAQDEMMKTLFGGSR